jgi:hypothetical protein
MTCLVLGHWGLAEYRERNEIGYARWARIVLPLSFVSLTSFTTAEAFLARRACNGDDYCAEQDIHRSRAMLLGFGAVSLFGPALSALLMPQRRPSHSLNVGTSGNALYVRGSF